MLFRGKVLRFHPSPDFWNDLPFHWQRNLLFFQNVSQIESGLNFFYRKIRVHE